MTDTTKTEPAPLKISPEAIDDLKRLARMIQAPKDLLEAATILRSYDNALNERKVRIAVLDAQEAETRARVQQVEVDARLAVEGVRRAHEAELARLGAIQRKHAESNAEVEHRADALRTEVADLEAKADAIRSTLAGVKV